MKLSIVVGTTAIVSLAVGSAAGYFIALKILDKKYQDQLQQEVESTKKFYAKLYKKDEFQTPESTIKEIAPGAAEAAAALLNYKGISDAAFEVVDEKREFAQQVLHNIFAEKTTEEISDKEKRNRTEEAPYILSKDEFMESDSDYTQSTVTYFGGDKVLVDSREDIIEDVDMTVGEGNLERFGHGSGDPNVLYVRNDRLEIEFEILLSQGKYSKEVAGLEE
jgi:hypothetical protein